MLTELISRHLTIGHEILDLEAELGIDTEPHKETLDKLMFESGDKNGFIDGLHCSSPCFCKVYS